MSLISTHTNGFLAAMESTFASLRERLGVLGLGLSIWDAEGQEVGGFAPAGEFCRRVCLAGAPCAARGSELARRALERGETVSDRLECGCCAVAVPIYQRRRLLGAAVACFPVVEMLAEGHVERLCDEFGLDRRETAEIARVSCRHSVGELQDFQRILEWGIHAEQTAAVAQSELTTLSTNLSTTYEELNLLYGISGSMKVTGRPEEFLRHICDELLEVMNISCAAALVYPHPPAVEEELLVVAGPGDLNAQQIRLLAGAYVAPKLARSGRGIVENHFRADPASGLGRAVADFVAAPLIAERHPIGMLIGINKQSMALLPGQTGFDSVDLKLIGSIANQTAVFLANHRLYADLQDLLMGVLYALTSSIDAKDPYTCGHSQRVAMISRRLAQSCGLPAARVETIYLAGLLHDIGKIGVPEAILRKPGRLSDEEYEQIKLHPMRGAKILEGIRQLEAVIPGVLMHHERLDGRGYPQGLLAEQVPLEGRIVCLADCFDAMTSERTYRKALPMETVVEEIRKHAGTQFDANLVEKFLAMDIEGFMEELRQPARTALPTRLFQEGWI
ncbi:MAG TPA: HD domain-containing protein [Phycisphaerae bacterium]|nr:HD domain-containing protein [Phycisphaerae bacterium]